MPFNRLVQSIDNLMELNVITEEVFMQIGHSCVPKSKIKYERFLSFEKMNIYADNAHIIISQGGPGSIYLALTRGKVPIVVPRQKIFGEMVDNHQVLFTQKLHKEDKILLVYDIKDLKSAFVNYEEKTRMLKVSKEIILGKSISFSDKLGKLISDFQENKKHK